MLTLVRFSLGSNIQFRNQGIRVVYLVFPIHLLNVLFRVE